MENKGTTEELACWDVAIQQEVFRRLLLATSYPGRVMVFDDLSLFKSTPLLTGILSVLVDRQTTLADHGSLLNTLERMRLEAPEVHPSKARFIVARGQEAPIFIPCVGTLESPEWGATCVVVVECLGCGETIMLQGPGIESRQCLAVQGLHPAWLEARSHWNSSFPMGVDLILLDSSQLACLPRTARIYPEEK